MKKIGLLVFFALVCASGLCAQSLQDNENYKKSVEFVRLAEKAMQDSDYDAARDYALEAQRYAALCKQTAPAGEFAASYVVKLNPESRDCLWKIAGYDFVYGDSLKWKRLYDANRDTFPNPDNPDLIVPGQVLTIPPLAGEARSGQR
jgi:nucleoid-associated protein YgaU